MMIIDELNQAIVQAFQKAFAWQPEEFNLTNPEPEFGDFALSCHAYARQLKMSPQEIATKLAANISHPAITKAAAVAGYLNLTIAPAVLGEEVLSAIFQADRHYGRAQTKDKEMILLEYSSPNTNKPLHLGHIRNNVLGMSLARLLQAQGQAVAKVQIINDRGIHIMKSLVAYQRWGEGKTPDDAGEKGDHFVGKFYVRFEQEFEREWREYLQSNAEIKNLPEPEQAKKRQQWFTESVIGSEAQSALQAWEAGDKPVRTLWAKMNAWVYEGFKATYQALGSEFDKDYYESQTYLLGKDIIKEGLKKKVFSQEADGSVWVDLTAEGLDKKVLQRADGTSVYVTQDLGLAAARHKEWNFDSLLYVVGHEQEYHFKVLFAALKKLGYKWADKLRHLSYGLVFLPEGKMKSREGKVVDADDIIAEVKTLAAAAISERSPAITGPELAERAGAIGLGALKFFLLRIAPTQSIHFNPAEAIAFEGATGPYVQYAHARINSILAEETPLPPKHIEFARLDTPEEKSLLLKLMQYPSLVAQAAGDFAPNALCEYLLGLARSFNTFYHKHQVLHAADDALKHARLLLVKDVQIVLRNGLELLGIEAPDKM